MIAGNIFPALVTTSTFVMSNAFYELLKIALKKDVSLLRNCFFNLASNLENIFMTISKANIQKTDTH